ncbi:TonB-dependent receptor [Microbulbifer elongatus]|uniref:TonB-dependent receptor n=1 Tax=Microbulbifer elongatus TaxID=86173 RepID=A0ABT1NX76_9GAMM|nr:TonB-dependent receptor [Microbulbifer elongatus]MCQ3828489.1 TonB-dependent receptor [Microbulbifer elongatus]
MPRKHHPAFNKGFNKKLLSIAVCGAVYGLLPGQLAAQEAEQIDDALVEEVVVYGDLRSNLQSAQDLKRDADTVKDVITASDIGALPDKSVTEALQRVSGVTIERFAASDDPNHYADEGTGVLVRGLDRVRSEINGRDAFSANPWGGLNYEDISPELLGAVEVVKNQTADLTTGGIAGTVNLITRKPLDSDEQILAFTAKANYGDFREEATPSFSGLFSDSWETDIGKIGFLVAGSGSEYKTRGDGVGVANYYSRGDAFIGEMAWGAVVRPAEGSPLEGPMIPGQEPGSVVYAPGQFSLRTAENDRTREGFASSVQWQSNDERITATLEHISSKAELEWEERVIGTQGQGFHPTTWFAAHWLEDEAHPITFDDGYLTSGIIRADAELPMLASSRYNQNINSVEDTSLNVTFRPTDRMTVSVDYQHVESEEIVHNYGINARVAPGSNASDVFLDLRGSLPSVEFLNPTWNNPGYWLNWAGENQTHYIATALDHEVNSDAEGDSFRLDLDYELDGLFNKIHTGMYYSDKALTMRNTEYANWGFVNEGWVKAQVDKAGPDVAPEAWETVDFSDFYDGQVLQGDITSNFYFPRMSLVKNFSEAMRSGCGTWNNAPFGSAGQPNAECYSGSEDLADRVNGPFAAHDISNTGEERLEAYIRADFAIDDSVVPVRGNVGLRYVSYQLDSDGYVVLPPAISGSDSLISVFQETYPDLYAFADGTGSVQSVEGTDYDTVLPSLNLVFNLSDDVLLRFGASRGLYFPTLDQARSTKTLGISYTAIRENPGSDDTDDTSNPVVGVTDVNLFGTSLNPNLEPEKADNFDLTTEWYFSDAGSVSMGLFYKKMHDIIRNRSFVETVTNPDNGISQEFSLAGPANTGSGSIQGVELSYSQFYDFLPGALSGLGLQLNYTYIDQNDLNDPESGLGAQRFTADGQPISDQRDTFRNFSGLPLEGYSDQNYNIVGMYEYNDFSMRLAYTWRSDYMVTRRDSNEFAPIYTEAAGMMDASLFYSLNDNWRVGLEIGNLLDLETKTLAQVNQEGTTKESLTFKTDRRYGLTISGNF